MTDTRSATRPRVDIAIDRSEDQNEPVGDVHEEDEVCTLHYGSEQMY
jgi:hypothetical protein